MVVANRYRIERLVSSGAFTIVADATDVQLDRLVTLKLIRPEVAELPEFQRRFDQVMRSMTTLSHVNVAAVHDWGEDRLAGRTTVFAAVEYLGGGSLRELLDRGRLLTSSQALVVGLDACRALDYAHRRNLAHGELTPSKLVFGEDRRLRVIDFGLARLLGSGAWREPATIEQHVARYASPEQALGQPIDAKSDVYALALTLIECVTGAVPFDADSTVATLSARVGKLTPVSADLGALASVLERAGRPDRNDRWTAAEFGRALIRAAENLPRPTPLPLVAAPVLRPEPTRRPSDPTGGVDRPGDADDDPEPEPPNTPTPVALWPPAAPPPSLDEPPSSLVPVEEDQAAPPEDVQTPPPPPAPAEDPSPAATDGSAGAIPLQLVHVAPLDLGPDAELDEPASPPATEVLSATTAPATEVLTATTAPATEVLATNEPPSPPPETSPDRPRRGHRLWLRGLVALVLVAALAGVAVLAASLLRTERHEVPQLSGFTEERARTAVAQFEWDVQTRRERSDDEPDAGQIIRTSPASGEQLAEGEPFFLVISDGPEFRALPDVVGLTEEAATRRLRRLQLEASTTRPIYDEEIPVGSVVIWNVRGEQTSLAGDEVLPGTEVMLTLSRGPAPRTVPDLRTLSIAQARSRIGDLGLRLEVGEARFSNVIERELIVGQRPRTDTRLERGATVTVIPSKGPDLVTFPRIGRLSFRDAVRRIEESGLQRGNVLGNTSGRFFRATIEGATAVAGERFPRNSRVDLVYL